MLAKISGPHHFSAYYEDNSLVIQFMMTELIHTYELTFQIKALMKEYFDSNQLFNHSFSSLNPLLEKLVGHSPQQNRSTISRWTLGSLTKLKDYCEQFSRNSSHQNKRYVKLHMAAHQAWLTGLHGLELLNSLSTKSAAQHSNIDSLVQSVKRTFENLQVRFNQVIRHVPKAVQEFWNNENVMLYLLRKRIQLTDIYGDNFLDKRFKWPVKNQEMVMILIQRYQERGFEALLSTIQNHLDKEGNHDNS